MKLLSVRSARSIWLVPLIHINPRGRFLLPAAAGLVQRYNFAKPPDMKALTTNPTNIVFEMGAFKTLDGADVYVNLTLHDDGIVAETRSSTIDSDRFLEDALTWISKEFELPMYAQLGIKRIYVSEVAVKFEKPLAIFKEKFETFSSSLASGTSSSRKPMELIQLNFGTDPEKGQQQMLRIEREAGTPFIENRYYSYCQIPTEEHLGLLQEFERAAS